MSKKILIEGKNIIELNHDIQMYRNETEENNPYIFASGETIQKMIDDCPFELKEMSEQEIKNKYPNGRIASYEGYKIFQNDDLKINEIELR